MRKAAFLPPNHSAVTLTRPHLLPPVWAGEQCSLVEVTLGEDSPLGCGDPYWWEAQTCDQPPYHPASIVPGIGARTGTEVTDRIHHFESLHVRRQFACLHSGADDFGADGQQPIQE